MGKYKRNKNSLRLEMRVIIALVVLIALNGVATQAMQKWMCCKNSDNEYVPTWGTACGSRRLQVMVEPYCPKKLQAPARILQAVVVNHPTAPNCSNFNGSRRLQAVVTYKCPVNIEGIQCFKNNTNAACKTVS